MDQGDQWETPSALLSVCSRDSSSGNCESYTAISGGRLRVAEWEQRWSRPVVDSSNIIRVSESGNPEVLRRYMAGRGGEGESAYSFMLDIAWCSTDEWSDLIAMFGDILPPPEIRTFLVEMEELERDHINTNRAFSVPPEYRSVVRYVLDLPVNTFPSTRRRGRGYAAITRWVRIVICHEGVVVLWYPPEVSSIGEADVPWPHNGVPTFEAVELEEMGEWASVEDRLRIVLQSIARHENYFAESWQSEIDIWQGASFRQIAREVDESQVVSLRDELGFIASHMADLRWSQRAFGKVASRPDLRRDFPSVMRHIESVGRALNPILLESRKAVSESFGILMSLTQSVQEEYSKRSEKQSRRLNGALALVSALVLIPGLVLGIYGANVATFNSGATGSIYRLTCYMLASTIVSTGVILGAYRHFVCVIASVVCSVSILLSYEIPSKGEGLIDLRYPALSVVLYCCVVGTALILSRSRNGSAVS